MYLFKYEGIIRDKLISYKFDEKSYLYDCFVKIILNDENACRKIKSYDIILPVPISKKRYKQRGYNQSELIAKKIAKELKIDYEKKCLYKIKDVTQQSKLSKNERKINIKDVYICKHKEKIERKNVLIVDDIYTTGSTVNECSKVLKKLNINKIGILTIAKD